MNREFSTIPIDNQTKHRNFCRLGNVLLRFQSWSSSFFAFVIAFLRFRAHLSYNERDATPLALCPAFQFVVFRFADFWYLQKSDLLSSNQSDRQQHLVSINPWAHASLPSSFWAVHLVIVLVLVFRLLLLVTPFYHCLYRPFLFLKTWTMQ